MIFGATLQQMLFLFSLIIIGYILMKFKTIPNNAERVLSNLESSLFIPALVLNTFISNFTVNKLASTGGLLLFSAVILAIAIALSLLCVKFLSKDRYVRKIYLYGLCFSNFSFMGNAIVGALFPEIFLEYVIFTLVLWVAIYLWGIPSLLIGDDSKKGFKNRLMVLLNPMLLCMVLGMIIGLSGIRLPEFVTTATSAVSACMSPVAMLITGMTIAKIDMKKVLKIKSIYAVTAIRLLAMPLIFIGIYYLISRFVPISLPQSYLVCALVSLAMPLGLNTIVIPSAYGKDTTIASGMALISHVISIVTIPLIFLIAGVS